MAKLKRIFSQSGNRFIDIIKSEDGFYILQQFIDKYDSEEEQRYIVRVFPEATSKFKDFDLAISEAERLMAQD